jgi:hypothetical protein
MKNRRLLSALIGLCLCACLLASCASGGTASVDTAEMESIGNEFVTELDGVIPIRENDDALLALGTLTVLDDKTHHLPALDTFYEGYRVGEDAALTIIYRTQSFIVYKIVFTGATGYYYRYELDPADMKAINIEARPLDEVQIEESNIGDIRKVVMTLKQADAKDVLLTFENIVEEAATASAD